MDTTTKLALILGTALSLAACKNVSGLSTTPRATVSQLACMDTNGDHHLNDADAVDPSKVPDFNGDHKHDTNDAAFLKGVDIILDPTRADDACKKGSKREPEYLVAHGYFEPSNVSCAKADAKAVLLVGVGGGLVNVLDKEDAAGVRSMIDGLQKAYDKQDVQTIAIIAGPALIGGQNVDTAMEQWITHAVQVYLDRYPCLKTVLLGHSHGAVTADVMAARLEGQYAKRIIDVVDVDRVEVLYIGDLASRPTQARVFNIYETNAGELSGKPYDSPNVDNWDASAEKGPENGDKGGTLVPVNHVNIDNTESVKKRIIDEVMRQS